MAALGSSRGEIAWKVARAAVTVAVNYVIWFLLPSLLLNLVPGLLPVGVTAISGFAVAIITLSAAGQILRGKTLGYIMNAAAALTSAIYLVAVTRLGNLELSIQLPQQLALNITLTFTPLAYLLLLPPLLSMLTNIWWIITKSSEATIIEQTIVESP
jgi:hypothetical protein